MLKAFSAVANAISTAVGGLLRITGPSAGTTRTMTVPDADFTAARTDAAQTFTGVQTLSSNPVLNGGTANGVVYLNASKSATTGTGIVYDGSRLGVGRAPATVWPQAASVSGENGSQLDPGYVSVSGNGGVLGFFNRNNGDGIVHQFYHQGTAVGSISITSTATSYNQNSDRRLKQNIKPAGDAGALLDAVQIVEFDWKVGGRQRFGVVAQDLHKIVFEAVKAGDDADEIKDTWGVDYSKLVPLLVKEVQSLRARVTKLERA